MTKEARPIFEQGATYGDMRSVYANPSSTCGVALSVRSHFNYVQLGLRDQLMNVSLELSPAVARALGAELIAGADACADREAV